MTQLPLSLPKASRLLAVAPFVLAFSAIAQGTIGSGTATIPVSGAPSGQTLQYSYTATESNETCDGPDRQIETTYSSFFFDGQEYNQTAQTFNCSGNYTNAPASLLLPTSYDPGHTCYVNFNPSNGEPYADLSCS